MKGVCISKGNSKMGAIPSVSLPAIKTCITCGCNKICYANKLARIRKNVRDSYDHNLDILMAFPDRYWREVEAAIMLTQFFRFHVSGDIPDDVYFRKMVEIAERNSHCQILCFTKKYGIVNTFCNVGGQIPENLHIIFSGWPGLPMNNPYNFPEAHVRFRDGTTTARPDATYCPGNCTECALTDSGCWALKHGEQVVFDEH